MDLQVTSKEIIKPSSPTQHHHQRTHKLSFLDQLNPDAFFSTILFFSAPSDHQVHTIKTSDHLKKSLSETLTHFYPFAGKFKDNNLSVDCNDDGVIFIEAHVAGDMFEVIKQAKTDILGQLIPCKPDETARFKHNLLVKVNYFGNGGMAIGICFHHKISDGVTAANFLKSWGLFARGANSDFVDVLYDDSNSIFPARSDLPDMSFVNTGLGLLSIDSIVKKFTFNGNNIASLREKIAKESSLLDPPTRVEAVSSVILSAVLAAYKGNNDVPASVTSIIAVNLRKRMNPPLTEQSFGNITSATFLNLPFDGDEKKVVSHTTLAEKLHKSIKMVDDQFVRMFYGEGDMMLNMIKGMAAQGLPSNNKVFVISSWCKLPFNETDFGWGKPVSIGLGVRFTDAAILVDRCGDDEDGGQGMEAWIGLSEQDMNRFQQHPDIIAYTSL